MTIERDDEAAVTTTTKLCIPFFTQERKAHIESLCYVHVLLHTKHEIIALQTCPFGGLL